MKLSPARANAIFSALRTMLGADNRRKNVSISASAPETLAEYGFCDFCAGSVAPYTLTVVGFGVEITDSSGARVEALELRFAEAQLTPVTLLSTYRYLESRLQRITRTPY